MLLPETGIGDSDKVAEKIRARIAAGTFAYKNRRLKVTMSFGVSVYDRPMSMEEVVDKADKCLYSAKESGRNRVISILE